MQKNPLILLIQENPADAEYIRQAVLNQEGALRLQHVDRAATALARIGGGGVALVILDLSSSRMPEIEQLDNFLKLRTAARQVPIIVVQSSEDDNLVMRAVRAGAAEHLPRERCRAELGRIVRSALEKRPIQPEALQRVAAESRKAGIVTAFLGAKGGVGTTTVALNMACALAQWSRVVIAELRPAFGTLAQYFHPHLLGRNIGHLLGMDPGTLCPADVGACLWPYKNIPGLNILFGRQTTEQFAEVTPSHARSIPKALSMLADYSVLDLPTGLTEANRAAIQGSDFLVVVAERDQFCVESAKRTLEALRSLNATPPLVGAVIVNRAALAAPMELPDIEIQLGVPILSVVPPAPDLCIAAQKAGEPLVVFEPESLVARSLATLAENVATQA